MNWKSFIASVINSLAWPSTLLIALLIVREPLASLIPQTSRVEVGQFSAEFSRDLKAIEKASPIANSQAVAKVTNWPEMQRLMQLAQSNPKDAVIGGWDLVFGYAELRLKAEQFYLDPLSETPYRDAEDALQQREILGPAALVTFNELRNLRNTTKYADREKLLPTQAIDYLELCAVLIAELQN